MSLHEPAREPGESGMSLMSPMSLLYLEAARLRREAHEAVHGEDMRLWRVEPDVMMCARSSWDGSNE